MNKIKMIRLFILTNLVIFTTHFSRSHATPPKESHICDRYESKKWKSTDWKPDDLNQCLKKTLNGQWMLERLEKNKSIKVKVVPHDNPEFLKLTTIEKSRRQLSITAFYNPATQTIFINHSSPFKKALYAYSHELFHATEIQSEFLITYYSLIDHFFKVGIIDETLTQINQPITFEDRTNLSLLARFHPVTMIVAEYNALIATMRTYRQLKAAFKGYSYCPDNWNKRDTFHTDQQRKQSDATRSVVHCPNFELSLITRAHKHQNPIDDQNKDVLLFFERFIEVNNFSMDTSDRLYHFSDIVDFIMNDSRTKILPNSTDSFHENIGILDFTQAI